MSYLEKLQDINLPIVLLLAQLLTYPFAIGIRNHEDPGWQCYQCPAHHNSCICHAGPYPEAIF